MWDAGSGDLLFGGSYVLKRLVCYLLCLGLGDSNLSVDRLLPFIRVLRSDDHILRLYAVIYNLYFLRKAKYKCQNNNSVHAHV